MTNQSPPQLTILTDGVGFVRKHPEQFLFPHSKPSGEIITKRLVSGLIYLNVYPIHVEVKGRYWTICCGKDWLADANGVPDYSVFFRLVAFPEYLVNSYREEILILAFAKYAATFDRKSGYKNLKGNLSADNFPTLFFEHNLIYERLLVYSFD